MQLPQLDYEPRHYSGCCASLSTKLLETLGKLLPAVPALTLSIGSGTGLLEATLLQQRLAISIEGVEVSNGVNVYLPDDLLHIVNWTGGLCSVARVATTWLFVYPRSMALIDKYIQTFGCLYVQSIVCVVPRADYHDLEKIIPDSWTEKIFEDCGLADWDLLICLRKGKNQNVEEGSCTGSSFLDKIL